MLKKDAAFFEVLENMPALNHKPTQEEVVNIENSALMKWLIAQPRMQNWLTREVTKSGAIEFNATTRLWAPKPKGSFETPRVGVSKITKRTLEVAHVLELVNGGCTKATDIIRSLERSAKVSRRTISQRLKDALWAGLLERTTPGGSYRIPEKFHGRSVKEMLEAQATPKQP